MRRTDTAAETRSVAAVLLDLGRGAPDAGRVEHLLFASDDSLRSILNEVSYGKLDVDVNMFGPYSLDGPSCLPFTSGGPRPDQANGAQVLSIIEALPRGYDHYFWLYDESEESEDCLTWGDQGSPEAPAAFASFTRHTPVSYAHEFAHNLGMLHEPSLECPRAEPLDDRVELCTQREYGNTLSLMGLGRGHPSAYQKARLGWIAGCDGLRVQTSFVVRLLPLELKRDGVQLVQIPAPKPRRVSAPEASSCNHIDLDHYYLELRLPGDNDAVDEPMVFVSLGPDLSDDCGVAPYALDQSPERGAVPTLANGGLARGHIYQDPAGGLSIEVLDVDETGATISLETDAPEAEVVCLDGTTFDETVHETP